MFLYSLTLQTAGGVHKAIYGNFSSGKAQEIVISRGKILEVYRSNETNGVLEIVFSSEVFGMIRSMCTFRMPGSNKDMLVIGSDSGKIVFLKLNPTNSKLEIVHMETYGKTGCRRIIPGQYVAADPKGRALMIAAIEKQKFVYILNRDNSNTLTISSPLEAHKGRTIVFDVCGVDVGYENPMFACLEVDYGEADQPSSPVVNGQYQKLLVFYEMDLGLNHVIRKFAHPIDNSANILITVPGGNDGPGGVLILCENFIRYYKIGSGETSTKVPRRADMASERGLLLNTFAMHKQKDFFFYLIQSELGDLYKVKLESNEIKIQYFDTIFPSISLCILKSGFLFAAAEFGNHSFYQFIGEGDDNLLVTGPESSYFMPKVLSNLKESYTIESLCAMTDMKVQDLCEEGLPQIYTLCGKSTRSSLRVLRHGLAVSEIALANLPAKPNGIWSIRGNNSTRYDRYILISFASHSIVLSVAEKVTEVNDSGFDTNSCTVHAGLLANQCYLQICQNSMRIIATNGKVDKWEPPGKITRATSNEKQVAITLIGGILIYFELDPTGRLKEVEKREMEQEVLCIHLPSIPDGRVRSRFLAVGLYDNTVKILSLDPEGCLGRLSTQAIPGFQPESLCLLEMGHNSSDLQLYLHVGLGNGMVLRTIIDSVTGQLSDTRSRSIGSKSVKLFPGLVIGGEALLALSSRTWLAYNYLGKHFFTPLSYESLEYAAAFSSEHCEEGFIGIADKTLRIFTIEKLGEIFNSNVLPLRYTPRKMEINPHSKHLVILEAEHNSFPIEQREQFKVAFKQQEGDEVDEYKIGTPKAGDGIWASCIRVVDPGKLETVDLIELTGNEHAVSVCICNFSQYEDVMFVVVGSVKDMTLNPRTHSGGFLTVFRSNANGKLEVVHKTSVEDVPLALCPFYGKILVGVGKFLRVYELGQKKLLKKSENKTTFPNLISNIKLDGERIFVSDIGESVSVLVYRKEDNQIYCFADDVVSRWLSAFTILDHDTVAVVDKFENFFVLRLPAACEDDEKDLGSVKYKWEAGFLNSAYYKMENIAQFYIGDLATCLSKCCLSEGGPEILLYGTCMGALGALIPLTKKEEVEFFIHLEMFLRQEYKSLIGRDHMAFRSFSLPVKNVVDGDLCEQFSMLSYEKQRNLCEELSHPSNEIFKRLEEIKNRIF